MLIAASVATSAAMLTLIALVPSGAPYLWTALLGLGVGGQFALALTVLGSLGGRTTLFRAWEPSVVPGLLQTPDYARGILTTVVDFHGIPDDVEEGVRARTDAQRVLTHGDRRFLLLLGEAALHTLVGDADIMQHQLRRLLEVSRHPRVSLGVVPLSAPYTVPRNNAFTVYDNRLVTVATYTAELALTQRHEVATYERAFDRLMAIARTGAAARDLIAAALNEAARNPEQSR